MHVVQAGAGSRVLVLLHGYPETWWQWRHTMPLFAKAGYRVIAIDYRGAGNSSKPPGGYDKPTMAGDVRALIVDHLGIEHPVLMVGRDIGMIQCGTVIVSNRLRNAAITSQVIAAEDPH